MTQNSRPNVALLFGGRSGEHSISLMSAASILKQWPDELFDLYLIGIDTNGRWRLQSKEKSLDSANSKQVLIDKNAPEVMLRPYPCSREKRLVFIDDPSKKAPALDLLFPILHGSNGEDGRLQGLCDLAQMPYVGCETLSSSLAMDKDKAKRIVASYHLPVVPDFVLQLRGLSPQEIESEIEDLIKDIQKEGTFPVFVKPAGAGSSLGVQKVSQVNQLASAIKHASQYGSKILIEDAIDAREIEFAILETPDSSFQISLPAEIRASSEHEFYSYDAKYKDPNGASFKIPAELTPEQLEEGTHLAGRCFDALEGRGLSRVDLFLDRKSGAWYFNEMNTLPGFTSISMYPRLFQEAGINFQELLRTLCESALKNKVFSNLAS